MLTKKAKGFTLLELVVAMAIFSVCVAMGLGIMTYALAQKAENTAELAIQDAFSTASATMVEELKAAAWPDYAGGTANAFLIAPQNATTTKELIFLTGTPGVEYRIRYYLDTSSPGFTRILKEKGEVASTTDPNALDPSTVETDPVTPYINQPVTVSFINNNGKITIIMGAKLNINGQPNDVAAVTISNIATAYIRNYASAPPVPGKPTGTIRGPAEPGPWLINTPYTYVATFSGGSGPLTYLWNDGETTSTATAYNWANPGTYTPSVTVTDAFDQATGKVYGGSIIIQSTLTVNLDGGGTVTPAGGVYPAGTVVTLVESPAPGYTFLGWWWDASGSGGTTTVIMNGDRTVGAVFAADPTP